MAKRERWWWVRGLGNRHLAVRSAEPIDGARELDREPQDWADAQAIARGMGLAADEGRLRDGG